MSFPLRSSPFWLLLQFSPYYWFVSNFIIMCFSVVFIFVVFVIQWDSLICSCSFHQIWKMRGHYLLRYLPVPPSALPGTLAPRGLGLSKLPHSSPRLCPSFKLLSFVFLLYVSFQILSIAASKFTNLFCNLYYAIDPTQCILHLKIVVLIWAVWFRFFLHPLHLLYAQAFL